MDDLRQSCCVRGLQVAVRTCSRTIRRISLARDIMCTYRLTFHLCAHVKIFASEYAYLSVPAAGACGRTFTWKKCQARRRVWSCATKQDSRPHFHDSGKMGKSARASGIKKNNQALKKRVFGPVETARNERLSAKLLELAQQPKPPRPEMEVEESNGERQTDSYGRRAKADWDAELDSKDADLEAKDKAVEADSDMDVDGASKKTPATRATSQSRAASSRRQDRLREDKRSGRVQKHRRERNRLTFAKHPMKSKKKSKK
nr:hypothetical protein CFP56_34744 [Quercus suber]